MEYFVHLFDLRNSILSVFMACKVENSGNAVSLITAILVPRLFYTVISRSKHNVLCHLFNSPHVYTVISLFGSRNHKARSFMDLLLSIHLHFLFVCSCAVTKQAEGEEHGLHMLEGLSSVSHLGW